MDLPTDTLQKTDRPASPAHPAPAKGFISHRLPQPSARDVFQNAAFQEYNQHVHL